MELHLAFVGSAGRRETTSDKDPALAAALERNGKRKAALTGTPTDIFATHEPGSSHESSWSVAGARFFVVTVTRQNRATKGTVFVAPDGSRYIFRPVRTREQANALAAEAVPDATIFAVRPYWGLPAKEWIAADPEFWKSSPMAKIR